MEGIARSEGDVRKKWTYLKWEAKNTSKPGRDPVSKQVLNILTSRDREVQEAMSLRNIPDRFPEDGKSIFLNVNLFSHQTRTLIGPYSKYHSYS